jgi:hypothetical protein
MQATTETRQTMRLRIALATALVAVGVGTGACGSSSGSGSTVDPNAGDVSPPGDIPDNQVFVPYSPPGAGYTVKVPEGWARTTTADGVQFTDKLNSVTLGSAKAARPLTAARARATVVPKLSSSVKGFSNPQVTTAQRSAGQAVLITYLAQSKPDPVTGKSVTDAVERYTFNHGGREAILILSGPQGADNVDPWRIVTDSLRWNG